MQTLKFLRVCINIVWATKTPIVICFSSEASLPSPIESIHLPKLAIYSCFASTKDATKTPIVICFSSVICFIF